MKKVYKIKNIILKNYINFQILYLDRQVQGSRNFQASLAYEMNKVLVNKERAQLKKILNSSGAPGDKTIKI